MRPVGDPEYREIDAEGTAEELSAPAAAVAARQGCLGVEGGQLAGVEVVGTDGPGCC
ncbi:hypothetical protein ACIQF6_23060 [Kitasatospora sp. NPDC092948]|uniref:hypothetical protein n=1 Tax=Kitasatospora sp. NPDC092948 TaxID=3364088 RepID=UPI0037F4379F